jgi:hypothetical protein
MVLKYIRKKNNPKDMARVTGRKGGFRAVSDLLAFRVKANTQDELAENLEKLTKIASEQNGKILLKPLYQGKPDVIRFAYIYFPTENVVVELQVGHELSFITFATDTLLAVSPELRQSRTDFWTNNFYTDMVSAILSGKTEKDLRANFLEIIKGKEEESEENSIRKAVLSIIDSIGTISSHL